MKRALTIVNNLLLAICLGSFAFSALIFEMAPGAPDTEHTHRVAVMFSLQKYQDTRYMNDARSSAYEVAGTAFIWSLAFYIGCSVALLIVGRKSK